MQNLVQKLIVVMFTFQLGGAAGGTNFDASVLDSMIRQLDMELARSQQAASQQAGNQQAGGFSWESSSTSNMGGSSGNAFNGQFFFCITYLS